MGGESLVDEVCRVLGASPILSGLAAFGVEVEVKESTPEPTSIEEVRDLLGDCRRCKLCSTRNKIVFGAGESVRPKLMVVGEGPGHQEDEQGVPFVGPAGEMLNRMLERVLGLSRSKVYITNVVKCLRYNARVQLGDGSWRKISSLVSEEYSGTVMAVDEAGNLVRRKVIGWHRSSLAGREVYRLTFKNAKRNGGGVGRKASTELTGDHEVLTPRGWVRVDSLLPDDLVATGQGMSDVARSVLIGTVLGDGHLSARSAHLEFSHCDVQSEWAAVKAMALREFSPFIEEFGVEDEKGNIHPSIRVRTLSNRSILRFRNDFYVKGKKVVPPWVADSLDPLKLAVWYLDDGHLHRRKLCVDIATHGFSGDDLLVLLSGLEGLGLQAKIRKSGRLEFDAENSRKLTRMVAPYTPPSMRYKLHPDVRDEVLFNSDLYLPGPKSTDWDVPEISRIEVKEKTFYCLEVEGDQNFVTSGGVVHNCRTLKNDRDPEPDEISSCLPFAEMQRNVLQPDLVLLLGSVAVRSCLKLEGGVNKHRGKWLDWGGVPTLATFHPAYLLRRQEDKPKAMEDLLLLKSRLSTL